MQQLQVVHKYAGECSDKSFVAPKKVILGENTSVHKYIIESECHSVDLDHELCHMCYCIGSSLLMFSDPFTIPKTCQSLYRSSTTLTPPGAFNVRSHHSQ